MVCKIGGNLHSSIIKIMQYNYIREVRKFNTWATHLKKNNKIKLMGSSHALFLSFSLYLSLSPSFNVQCLSFFFLFLSSPLTLSDSLSLPSTSFSTSISLLTSQLLSPCFSGQYLLCLCLSLSVSFCFSLSLSLSISQHHSQPFPFPHHHFLP